MTGSELDLPDGYEALLAALRADVRGAQYRAQRVVNTQLLELYWRIGSRILALQREQGWGSRVIARLAEDLRASFPTMKGFSPSNLQYMRAFAAAWPEGDSIHQQPVGKLPWGHVMLLLDRFSTTEDRNWYAAVAVERGWSRNMLLNQIKNRTRERIGAATTNFEVSLPKADSDLARQISKDPYVFDFLDLSKEAAERDLEQALMDRIVDTLRELGAGFAFVGRQVHFDVVGDDFFLDLLFFHTEQLRYVVVELKTGKFEPAYAGQLGFYIAVVDDTMRREFHRPTVGILICGSHNDRTVRYALSQSASPMAVSTYSYDTLPPAEQEGLPSAEQISAALDWPDAGPHTDEQA
jgi:predicted nuclease of restriction endonuclease-like (RecB) superfamily